MSESTAKATDFIHRFVAAPRLVEAVTLLVLHGTGGSEDDLLPLGQNDPIVPIENTAALIALFEQAGAEVATQWHSGGHSLIPEEVQTAQAWLHKRQA